MNEIKNREEILKSVLGEIRYKLNGSLTNDDIQIAMQSYSDQNLTEYKRRLLDRMKSFDDEAYEALIQIIDSIDINKK